MSIDAATFVDQYPEFVEVQSLAPDMVLRCLRIAKTFCDATIFGSSYEDGVMCKAAALLAMTPFGENARLAANKSSSCYEVVFEQMVKQLPVRVLCAGVDDDCLPDWGT